MSLVSNPLGFLSNSTDYAGPFLCQMFFIVVDAHFKGEPNKHTYHCFYYLTPMLNLCETWVARVIVQIMLDLSFVKCFS